MLHTVLIHVVFKCCPDRRGVVGLRRCVESAREWHPGPYIECVFENDLVELERPARTGATPQTRRRVPLRRSGQPLHRYPTPSPTSALTAADPPGQTRIGNLGPQIRGHHRLKPTEAGRSGNPNPTLGCGNHHTTASTWSTPPAPIPSATPGSLKKSGVPQRTHRRNWLADPISHVSLAVRWQPDSLITSDAVTNATSGPARHERAVRFAAHSARGNLGGVFFAGASGA